MLTLQGEWPVLVKPALPTGIPTQSVHTPRQGVKQSRLGLIRHEWLTFKTI